MSLPKHGTQTPAEGKQCRSPCAKVLERDGLPEATLQQSKELHSVSGQKRVFTVTNPQGFKEAELPSTRRDI